MKKTINLILIIIVVLMLPIIAFAEDINNTELLTIIPEIENTNLVIIENDNMTISEDIEYENGMYKLVGNVRISSANSFLYNNTEEKPVYYTCHRNNTECRSITAVYPKMTYFTSYSTSRKYMAVQLKNGQMIEEDLLYFYYSDEYEKLDNGHYKLVNATKDYLYNVYKNEKKYVCKELYKDNECEDIYYIIAASNDRMMVDSISSRLPFGKYYTYKDGKFILKDTKYTSFTAPNNNLSGLYTCLNQEEVCEKLYKIDSVGELQIESELLMIIPIDVSVLKISHVEETELNLNINKNMTIPNIQPEDRIIIENEEIIAIEVSDGSGKIIPKKEGETDVTIISSTEEARVLHVNISAASLTPSNPNTDVFFPISLIIIVLISLSTMIILLKIRRD